MLCVLLIILLYIVFKRTDAFGRSRVLVVGRQRVFIRHRRLGGRGVKREGSERRREKDYCLDDFDRFVYVDDSFYGVYGREGFRSR